MVRIALWALRVYLLILLSLIGMKFVRMFAQSRSSEKTATVPARPDNTAKPAQ